MPRPHGGKLVNLESTEEEKARFLEETEEMPKIQVSRELTKIVENISDGVLSPLEGFLGEDDYLGVVEDMRLASDLPWTIPILLDIEKEKVNDLEEGDELVLVDEQGLAVAVMHLEEKYSYDRRRLAKQVLGTTRREHPGVAKVYSMKDLLLGGTIRLLKRSEDEFLRYRLKPIETRVLFKEKSNFQTLQFTPNIHLVCGREVKNKASCVSFTTDCPASCTNVGLFTSPCRALMMV